YNSAFTHADLPIDIPFMVQYPRQAYGRVLELGRGSGRLLFPLAQAGAEITGIDLSAAMLAQAQARLAALPTAVGQRIRLHPMDMTQLALDGRFGLIIIPYNTLMHLDSAQLAATLKKAAAHLLPGGKLLIDLDNPFIIANGPEDQLLNLENVFTDPA